FIRCLVNSGLMTAEDVEAVQRRLPDDRRPTSAAEFAGYLCEQQVLTDYQTGVLSRGSSDYLVLGDYELQEILGSGGMGTVFRARHRRMRRTVALKVLPESQLDSAEAVERFHREVEAAGRVDHPNIVRAFDAREDDGLHYLVMEYVEGEDLARQVRHSGPLSPRQAVDCILQAARGLACAHANGIVHRDVKPSNLLRDGQGVIKVLDLGLARLERPDAGTTRNADRCELTEMGITMGTVGYMAPEQAIDSRQADERADVYGLGCTLYYLLTGQAMFPGRTKMQELIAHREETPPGLRETLPGLPESLDATYRKMVSRRPENRFQSMESVIAELERIQATGDLPPDEADLRRTQRENPPVNSSDSTDRHGQSISQTDPARQSSPASKAADDETTRTSGVSPAPASRQLDLRTILATLGCVLAGGLLVLVAMTWPDRDGRTVPQPVPDVVPADNQAAASGASGQLPDEQLSEQIGQALQSLSPGRAGHAAVLALVNQVSDTLAGRGETALVSGAVEGPAGSELGPRVRQIVEQAIQAGPVQLSRRIATKLSGDVWLAGSGKSLAMIVELELRDRDNARIVSFEQRVPLDPASPDPYARLSEIGDLSAHAAVSRELDRLAGRIAEYMESRGESQFVSGSIDGPVDVEVAPLRTGLMQRLAELGLRQERMHGLKVGADVLLELAPQQSEFLLRINVELRDRNNQLVHSIPSGPVIIQ
ncbi:MAG: serine/threonine protein kinase, partial [Planctomycetaceae bacterium]|nr:serine/threonine protein kinase [Planctomycetaceae bacterium]